MPKPNKITVAQARKNAKAYASVEREIANLFKQKAELEQTLSKTRTDRELIRQNCLAKKRKLKAAIKEGILPKKELIKLQGDYYRAQFSFCSKNADVKECAKTLNEIKTQTTALISASSWYSPA